MAPQEHRFPCNICGADMRFDPGTGALSCDHCGATEKIDENPWNAGAIKELDFKRAAVADLPEVEMETLRITKCENCGAEVEFHAHDHASECPFCATPVVIGTGTSRHIKPRGVLPFALSEKQGRNAMNAWLGRLWFAPNGLKAYARAGRKMQGIYVPYWTYDADTKSRYKGQRGTIYYVTEKYKSDGKTHTRQVQKIRWNSVSGRVARFFDDVLVLGSTSLPKKYTDALSPWDLSALEPYNPEYLAGFRAEGYSVDLETGYIEAREIMERRIVRDVKFDIGGDRQRINHLETRVKDVTFKHILLPVWLAAYKYRGKSYRFVVNAQSGAVKGERPYSVIKIVMATIAVAILATAIGYVVYTTQ
ncbi:MAG: primosomal protein N' (replication factor Y) - superfamily II helicase [Paracoccaceae bacterium]